MKAMIIFIILFVGGWFVYFNYFHGKGRLGIDDMHPVGKFDQLYKRLSHTRFKKAKKDLANGDTAYLFTDERANKMNWFREGVTLVADKKKNVKGLVVYYIADSSGLYKTPASQFLIKYWKMFTKEQGPDFETSGPRFNTKDVAKFAADGAVGEWITNDSSQFFSYAFIYPATAGKPALFPAKQAAPKEVKKEAAAKKEAPKKIAKSTTKKKKSSSKPKKRTQKSKRLSSKSKKATTLE